MPEVPHFGGRALKKLELRGRGRGDLAFDDAGANATQCAPGTIRGELALSILGQTRSRYGLAGVGRAGGAGLVRGR
jgi:hypothetical protein